MNETANARLPIHAATGTELTAKSWQTEAPLRMLMNNLDPDNAERPEELVVYGGTGKAARSWEAYDALVRTLRDLEDDETMLVQSGKPVGVMRTHEWAPRVLIANSNLVGDWATWPEFRRLEKLGLTMYGQMTAGSWIYIGTQGILQGTYETFAAVAEKRFGGTLAGTITVTLPRGLTQAARRSIQHLRVSAPACLAVRRPGSGDRRRRGQQGIQRSGDDRPGDRRQGRHAGVEGHVVRRRDRGGRRLRPHRPRTRDVQGVDHHRPDAPDLWPDDVREEMEEVMQRVFTEVNNGVYRCGFAGSQESYEEAYDRLWTAMDWLEERLADRRYLMGDSVTEADVRLFTTLARFDAVYHGHFKCNERKLTEFANLWPYARDLYQTPGFGDTTDFAHIKTHYYATHEQINPTRIVPKGPALAGWDEPHGRDHLGDRLQHVDTVGAKPRRCLVDLTGQHSLAHEVHPAVQRADQQRLGVARAVGVRQVEALGLEHLVGGGDVRHPVDRHDVALPSVVADVADPDLAVRSGGERLDVHDVVGGVGDGGERPAVRLVDLEEPRHVP